MDRLGEDAPIVNSAVRAVLARYRAELPGPERQAHNWSMLTHRLQVSASPPTVGPAAVAGGKAGVVALAAVIAVAVVVLWWGRWFGVGGDAPPPRDDMPTHAAPVTDDPPVSASRPAPKRGETHDDDRKSVKRKPTEPRPRSRVEVETRPERHHSRTRRPSERVPERPSDRSDPLVPDLLAREAALVKAMKRALDREQYPRALELAREHAGTFPHGALQEEREAVLVIAGCRLNRANAVRTRARFEARYPASPLAGRIEVACSKR